MTNVFLSTNPETKHMAAFYVPCPVPYLMSENNRIGDDNQGCGKQILSHLQPQLKKRKELLQK